nr:30S ribosomal protein S4e [Candidatus Njordarchaeota archaeon]
MGRKGPRRHMKRLAVPTDWRIPKHRHSWAVRPRSGPHPIDGSIPLLNLLRETLSPNYVAREAKRVLYEGKVLVDGVARRDHKFPVGLMDVITIPVIEKAFRVLPFPKRGLGLQPIQKNEAEFKLCCVVDKTLVKGGDLQLNLHDGRNIVIRKDKANEELSSIKTHDTLKIEVPTQKIIDIVRYEVGTLVLISGGKNVGLGGRVQEVNKPKGTSMTTSVTLKTDDGTTMEVPLNYTFAIGKEEPLISYSRLGGEQVIN